VTNAIVKITSHLLQSRSLKGVAVHKLLLHSKCLWCGFEDKDVLCMICVGTIRGFTLLQLFWQHETGETSAPHFYQLTNLEGCDTYEELVGSKAIPSKSLKYVYSGSCVFLIKDCRYSSDLTPQNTSEPRQILSACHRSHAYAKGGKTVKTNRMVGSSEVTLSPLNFTYMYI